MSEGIYLFNKNQELIESISPELLLENYQVRELNGQITGFAKTPYSEDIENAMYFGVKDNLNFWMYKIRSFIKEDGLISLEGIHIFFDDLKGQVIRDIRPQNQKAGLTVERILENTGWSVIGDVDNLASANFYHVSALSAFWDAVKIWNFEFIPKIEFLNGEITSKTLHIYSQISNDYGKWYEYGDKLISVVAENSTDELYTAFIGRGKGIQLEDSDGFSRKIKFDDIEYTATKNGTTVNKPVGQDYIEIVQATQAYGYPDGSPRIGVVDFDDIEDKVQLADATFEYALNNCRPKVQLKASAIEGENVELGETVAIIRSDMNIRYKVRVFKIQKDFLQGKVVSYEFGDKIVTSASERLKLQEFERKKLQEQFESYMDYLRAEITSSYFNEDGYNYDLKVGNEYGLPAGYYSFDKPIDMNPQKVIYIGAGKILISNEKNPDGSWKWKTFGDGDGIVAENIVGTLGEFANVNANQIVIGADFGESALGEAINNTSNRVRIDANGIMVYNDETVNYTIDLEGLKSDVTNAVIQNKLYNGVKINTTEGLTVVRSDGRVKVTVNATEGLRIDNKKTSYSAWKRAFYVNTTGQAEFTGDLKVLNEEGNVLGSIYASETTNLAIQAFGAMGLVDSNQMAYLQFGRELSRHGTAMQSQFHSQGVGFILPYNSFEYSTFAIAPKPAIGYMPNNDAAMFLGFLKSSNSNNYIRTGFQFESSGVYYMDQYGKSYSLNSWVTNMTMTAERAVDNRDNLIYVLDELQRQNIFINRTGLK